MPRFIHTAVAFVFLVWILPLGVFIKPWQERVACGGQRAICLCSHRTAKPQNKVVEKISLKINGSSVQKEEGSTGGVSHFFLVQHNNRVQSSYHTAFSHHPFFLYACPHDQAVEHVPKA